VASDDDQRSPDDSWNERVTAFWGEADDERPADAWAALEPLLAERPVGDAAAAFERASLHDMLGEDHAAIPHYRAAMAAGLGPERQGYATIQLASTLRNVGELDEAAALLESMQADDRLGAAARAFLALTLHDAGRRSDALRMVLTDYAPHVPLYGRALGEYAALLPNDELTQK
jgi:tetratricopeptide (TPR) repeat protein